MSSNSLSMYPIYGRFTQVLIRMSLKRTPRFRLAPRGGQNSARSGYRAILHGEFALGALKGRFWLPGRSVCIGGRAPAPGAHPSAGAALGVRNG